MTAPEQLLALRSGPAGLGTGAVRHGRLHWRYPCRPTGLSRSYDLRIAYRVPERPTVIVEAPDLSDVAQGRDLPHVYGESPVELCLHHPAFGEWTPALRIDRTIVPWVALWLYYFEDWLATDDWRGGGLHPGEAAGMGRTGRRAIKRGRQTR